MQNDLLNKLSELFVAQHIQLVQQTVSYQLGFIISMINTPYVEQQSEASKRIYDYGQTPAQAKQSLAGFYKAAQTGFEKCCKEALQKPLSENAQLRVHVAGELLASVSHAFSDLVVQSDGPQYPTFDVLKRPPLPKSKTLVALKASKLGPELGEAVLDVLSLDIAKIKRGRAVLNEVIKSGSVRNSQYAAVIFAQLDDPINRFKLVRLGESIRELANVDSFTQDARPHYATKRQDHLQPLPAAQMPAIEATGVLQVAMTNHPKIVKPVPMSITNNLDAGQIFDLESGYEQ